MSSLACLLPSLMTSKSNLRARRWLIIVITVVILRGLAGIFPPASAAECAEYAVVIVIDGCRPEYFQLAPLPHIGELAGRGITYDWAWVGQLPTNTPPGHATLGTGVFPARHHVVGFRWKESETGKSLRPCKIEKLRSGVLLEIMSDAGVPSVFGLYKKAYPAGCTLAISSVKPYAALGMGTSDADFILFTPSSKKGKAWGEEGIEKGQVCLFESLSGHSVEKQILDQINHQIRPYKNAGDFDTWVVDAFLAIFDEKRPTFTMMNLPEIDEMGHACGGTPAPEAMRPVIENVDIQIGRIVEAYKSAGIFEKTLFVVTADHGMVPNAYNVCVGSYVDAFLRPQDFVQLGLTGPSIWLRNSTRSKAVAGSIANMNILGMDGVFYKKSDIEKVSYHKVSHGVDDMYERVWSYLLRTVACPNSPDIFLRLRENTIIGRKFPLNQRGKHYQGTWGAQHIPLIMSGPGVSVGIHSDMPARLVDISPTVLALMDIGASGMDGIVLADALKTPSPEQTKMQAEIGTRLKELQKALLDQSQYDLKQVPLLPEPRFWNLLWLYDSFAVVFLGLMLLVIKKARVPGKVKKAGLSAGFFLLIASQVLFVLILWRMLEI